MCWHTKTKSPHHNKQPLSYRIIYDGIVLFTDLQPANSSAAHPKTNENTHAYIALSLSDGVLQTTHPPTASHYLRRKSMLWLVINGLLRPKHNSNKTNEREIPLHPPWLTDRYHVYITTKLHFSECTIWDENLFDSRIFLIEITQWRRNNNASIITAPPREHEECSLTFENALGSNAFAHGSRYTLKQDGSGVTSTGTMTTTASGADDNNFPQNLWFGS